MKRSIVPLGAAALFLALASQALAEPYMAVREGLQCGACHVNVTGGGKRTALVATHANEILRVPDWEFMSTFNRPTDAFTGEVNQYLGLGSDLRVNYQAIFQDEPDDTGRVDNDKVFRGHLESNELDVSEATIYLEARLIPDVLTLYVDQSLAPNTNNREAWGMVKLPWWQSFLKAGRMFLPYGLELQDDTAFIRGGYNGSANTGFSFQQQQAGFEVGMQPDPFSAIVAVTNGPAGDNDVQVTGNFSLMLDDVPLAKSFYLGASFSHVNPPSASTTLFCFYTGTTIEELTLLGEVDFRYDNNSITDDQTVGTFLAYAEVDYLFFEWLNAKFVFNYADDDGDLSQRSNDSENRFGIGLEPFINRFFQPRLFYYVGNGVRTQPTHNQSVLLAQLHFFF